MAALAVVAALAWAASWVLATWLVGVIAGVACVIIIGLALLAMQAVT